MLRITITFLFLLVGNIALHQKCAAAAILDGDHIPTRTGQDLVIHPLKHATLALGWNSFIVYVDPALVPGSSANTDASVLFAGLPAPDLILISHEHPDHFDPIALGELSVSKTVIIAPQSVIDKLPEALKGHSHALANGQRFSVGNIQIEAVPSYNTSSDRLQFHPKGRDNGYVVSFGGTRVYLAGDTEGIPEMRALKSIDVAFIPMNLPYTMTPEAAADAVNAFKPKIVYPYHYGNTDVTVFAKAVASGTEVRQRNWY